VVERRSCAPHRLESVVGRETVEGTSRRKARPEGKDEVGIDEMPSGTEDARHLGESSPPFRDVVSDLVAEHDVELAIPERERAYVGDTKAHALGSGIVSAGGEDLLRVDVDSRRGATVLIDRLDWAGLVSRRPHPSDRRSLLLELEEAKLARVREAIAAYHAALEGAVESIPSEHRAAVSRFLAAAGDAAAGAAQDLLDGTGTR
jgi:hypothetical protein